MRFPLRPCSSYVVFAVTLAFACSDNTGGVRVGDGGAPIVDGGTGIGDGGQGGNDGGPGGNDGGPGGNDGGAYVADAGPPCPAYQSPCDGGCIPTSVDPVNCGACGRTCDAGTAC